MLRALSAAGKRADGPPHPSSIIHRSLPGPRRGNQDVTRAGREQLLRYASEEGCLQPAAAVRAHCKKVGAKTSQCIRDDRHRCPFAKLNSKACVWVQ
jgi:hypothetical protein